MKRFLAFLPCLILLLSACGAPANSGNAAKVDEVSSEVQALPVDDKTNNAVVAIDNSAEPQSEENTPATQDTTSQQPMEKLVVADSARYRGVVEDVAVSDDGSTVLILNRAVGTNLDRTKKVKLTADTKYSFESAEIANGAFLEVYYGADGANEDESVDAIAINNLGDVNSVNYNGTVLEITKDGDSGSIYMDPLDEKGMQYVFNYGPETQFYLDINTIKVGDKLNVYHKSMATRSIPPQSPALEFSVYTAPEEGEAPIAIAE